MGSAHWKQVPPPRSCRTCGQWKLSLHLAGGQLMGSRQGLDSSSLWQVQPRHPPPRCWSGSPHGEWRCLQHSTLGSEGARPWALHRPPRSHPGVGPRAAASREPGTPRENGTQGLDRPAAEGHWRGPGLRVEATPRPWAQVGTQPTLPSCASPSAQAGCDPGDGQAL